MLALVALNQGFLPLRTRQCEKHFFNEAVSFLRLEVDRVLFEEDA